MRKFLPFLLPLFRSVIFIFGGLSFIHIFNLTYEEAFMWWTPLCSLYNIITIWVFIYVMKIEKTSYKELIRHQKGQILKLKTLLFLILMMTIGGAGMIGLSFLFYQSLPEFLVQPIPLYLALINLVIFPITIVFAEMPLYFGYALKKIHHQTQKPVIAITYTVFFYALQHSFIPLLFDVKYIIYRFLSFLPLALFLSIRYLKKNDLSTMMIGHGVMDLSTAIQILLVSI